MSLRVSDMQFWFDRPITKEADERFTITKMGVGIGSGSHGQGFSDRGFLRLARATLNEIADRSHDVIENKGANSLKPRFYRK
jgi:hypothetical protein